MCDVILGSRKHGFFKQREQCRNAAAAATVNPNLQPQSIESGGRVWINRQKKKKKETCIARSGSYASSSIGRRRWVQGVTPPSPVLVRLLPRFSLKICSAGTIIIYHKHTREIELRVQCSTRTPRYVKISTFRYIPFVRCRLLDMSRLPTICRFV